MTAFSPDDRVPAEPTLLSRLGNKEPLPVRESTRVSRRSFLKLGAGSAVMAAGVYGIERRLVGPARRAAFNGNTLNVVTKTLVATDGWVSGPDDATVAGAAWPDNLAPANRNYYIFGFAEGGQFETPDQNGWSSIWTGDPKPGLEPTFDVDGGTTQSGLPQVLVDPSGNPIYDANFRLSALRGQANFSAPILYFHEGDDIRITLWNGGLPQRPDIVDTHTIHWHGFPNQIPYFDGVPSGSLSVPQGRNLVYRYLPYRGMAGAYMYHCHVGDVEHVQMGLQGIVFIRPYQNFGYGGQPVTRSGQIVLGHTPAADRLGYVYNDGSGVTAYDREFAFIIDEIDTRIHWDDSHLGDQDFTEYAPKFFTLNGRSYPDTILPNGPKAFDQVTPRFGKTPLWLDPANPAYATHAKRLGNQPWSSLMQANEGETVLLRFSNLGYQEHSMELQGLAFTVVGKDAKSLLTQRDSYQENPNPDYAGHTNFTKRDGITYTSYRVDLGPGESRELLVKIPVGAGGPKGSPTVFNFLDRNDSTNNNRNAGGPNVGGMRTELHVFNKDVLPKQDFPQQLFPEA
jgi:FtsP/CotA-like multicopper oxidase with cupredoxin domain